MSLREDLDNLLKSPGWQWLVNEAHDYWRDRLGQHVAACANDTDDVAALNKLRQVVAAKDAVERFIAKPQERLKQEQQKEGIITASEREASSAMSRRGGL